jgi:hypothetical protein
MTPLISHGGGKWELSRGNDLCDIARIHGVNSTEMYHGGGRLGTIGKRPFRVLSGQPAANGALRRSAHEARFYPSEARR